MKNWKSLLTTNRGEEGGRQRSRSGSWSCSGDGLLKENVGISTDNFLFGLPWDRQSRRVESRVHWMVERILLCCQIMRHGKLTGAMVRLATTAASGTFVNELVVVAVVFWT